MKKLTLSILSLIFLLCAAIGFVGCGKKHTHLFTVQKAEQQYLASAATCTESAKYYYSCTCGESERNDNHTFTSGNALGHKFTNYVSDNNATCTTDGTKTSTCDHSGCNEKDTIADAGSKLGHKFTNYVSDNNATCTQDGTKTATCDHDGCNAKDTVTDAGSKLPHTFDKQVATEEYLASAATCTEAAKYYYSCTCGESEHDEEHTFTYGSAKNHNYGTPVYTWSSDYSTCTATRVCQNDGNHIETETATAMVTVTQQKSCTLDELSTYTATFKNSSFATQTKEHIKTADKLNHDLAHHTAKAATCTEIGWYEYDTCTRCDYTTYREISALNHNYATDWTIDIQPTCTEAGEKSHHCTRCDSRSGVTVVDKIGHKFTNYVSDNNATCANDGTKTAKCERCDETDTKPDNGSKLPHTFNKQVVTEKYLASAATCTEAARYYYSCECGEKGTETFASGNPNGHTYSEKWSQSETEHWHASTCGHNAEKDRAKHTFDGNKKCIVCDYVTTKPLGLELQSSVFDINLATKTAYLKVANAVTDYDFSDKFAVAAGAKFDVCTDKQCNNKIASKRTDIVEGDNVFYILVTNGNDVASYTVTLRRRPIYTVTFNTNGGSEVETQYVEEDDFAVEPTTTRKGYDFIEWDYDFSSPILKNQAITASWNIITYNINYVLNGGENAESNPTTYTVEDEIALSLPTKTGYTGSWSSGGKIEKGSIGDITFTASYTINQYKVTVTPSINGICAFTDKSGTYDYNTAVSLSLSDIYLGYEFVGWYNGETLLSTDNVYTFNVPANDITITAKLSVKKEMQIYNFSSTANRCNITGVKDKTITSAVIPDSVTSIGYEAFKGCYKLTSVTIPDSVTSIGNSAFSGCSGLMSITIPDSVTSIGNYAFYGCSKITNITLPFVGASKTASNTHFGYIFGASSSSGNNQYVPSNLKTVIISNKSGVTSIDDRAFYGCSKLTSITIPDGVTSIGSSAFSGCTGLTSITIPDGVTSIGNSAFSGCSGLTSITIPDSVTSIGNYAFDGCNGLENIYITDIAAWCNITGISSLMWYGTNNKKLYLNNELITDLLIPDNITSIGNSAFYNCSGLTSITIPDSVTSIGDSAFDGCSGLTSVTIGNGVTSIGYNAFYGCIGLENITVSSGNTKYHSSGNCLIETESKELVLGCKNSIIPSDGSVTSIGSAFRGCSGLTSITIPDSVTSIGSFYGCSELESITIPDSVTYIGESAFVGCSGLTSVTIGNGVTSIGKEAFYECGGLKSVTIGNGVKTIWNSAFYGCSGLTSITIPDSVTYISWCAFRDCSGLKSVTIGNGVTSIGEMAFYDCSGLTSIVIPDSVTSIGSSAFYNCSGLTSITITDSVTSIGSAFDGCSGLEEIHFNGTMAQWSAISKGANWNNSTGSYTIYCTDGNVKK